MSVPDPYTTLAELLRELAAKMPEKFQVVDGNYLHFSPEGKLPKVYEHCFDLDELSDPIFFSLDDMDAICAAVGMCFDVHRMGDGTWYGSGITIADDTIRCDSGFHPDKRIASVYATIACLRYAMGEKGETG